MNCIGESGGGNVPFPVFSISAVIFPCATFLDPDPCPSPSALSFPGDDMQKIADVSKNASGLGGIRKETRKEETKHESEGENRNKVCWGKRGVPLPFWMELLHRSFVFLSVR